MRRIVPCLLLALLVTRGALAQDCDCLWQGPFIDAQQRADLVLQGTVTAQRGNSFDLSVEHRLRGEIYLDTVRIWGAYPGTCRPPAAAFQPGTRWIMAVDSIDQVPPGGFNPATPGVSFGRAGDYSLSRCGVYWLPVREDLVHGNLAGRHRWQYDNPQAEPIRPELLAAWLQGDVPRETLEKSAAPNPEARRLRAETQRFLRAMEQQRSRDAFPDSSPDSSPNLPAIPFHNGRNGSHHEETAD